MSILRAVSDPAPVMLQNRLRKTARHLRKWARREGVSCYRLYERDIPEVPLIVDWYEGRLHVAEQARGVAPEPAEVETWLDAAAAALDVERAAVFFKRRERQRGTSQYERQGEEGARFVVREGGHRFLVNLSDYLDTGLFLDHRLTRARVQAEAAGRRVLNLFAYTGAFSVYAAAGGARSTTSVDLSNTYLEWARENLALNGQDGVLLRADALPFIEARAAAGERFDLVIVDPPTFSNSKKMDGVFDVQRDHAALLSRVLDLTPPGGLVLFSTNARRFRFEAGALRADVVEISAETRPPDFRVQPHRCWRLVRR